MRFHDFHLEGYEVKDKGESIILHLVSDYPGAEKEESQIAFGGVTLYNFTHTSGSIITNIEERPVSELASDLGDLITRFASVTGVDLWQGSLDTYIVALQERGFKGWRIEAAVGFCGFIFAKTIGEA